MLFALVYAVIRLLFDLVIIRSHGEAAAQLELLVLRHEVAPRTDQLPRSPLGFVRKEGPPAGDSAGATFEACGSGGSTGHCDKP
jgi:hypothetical protein